VSSGVVAFNIVGLADKVVAESCERVRAALSARGWHRIRRVARTIADLDGSEGVRRVHIAEALGYRRIAPGR